MPAFDVDLSAVDIVHMATVRAAVDTFIQRRPLTAGQIRSFIECCYGAASRMGQHNDSFPYAYVGMRLAKCAQSPMEMDQAMTFLELDTSENPFSRILADYLKKYGSMEPRTTVFGSANPYDAWEKTHFCQRHLRGITEAIVSFSQTHPPPSLSPTVVDIGPGNGILLARFINALATTHALERVHLVLIDQSEGMLQRSADHCRTHVRIPHEITAIHGRLEDLTAVQRQYIAHHCPIWFAHAAAALHHMPWEDKIRSLRMLSALTRHCLLFESEGNHDLPEADSPELFYSVRGFYGYLFHDVIASPITAEEQRICLEDFLLAESLVILRSERRSGPAEHKGRVDYHTSMQHWMALATQAGYQVHTEASIIQVPHSRVATYFLGLETAQVDA